MRAEAVSVLPPVSDSDDGIAWGVDQLERLSLLRCCLKEALRLCPSAPMRGRTALAATQLPCDSRPPLSVSAGQTITFSIYKCDNARQSVLSQCV